VLLSTPTRYIATALISGDLKLKYQTVTNSTAVFVTLVSLINAISIITKAIGLDSRRRYAIYTVLCLIHFGFCGTKYLYYWGMTYLSQKSGSPWRRYRQIFNIFIMFWNALESVAMLAPVAYLSYVVVIKR
jgi:hypothetical protein